MTEREIELAQLLKEAGLEWEPEPGDWFYDKVQEDCFTAVEITDVIKSWYNQYMHDFDIRSCVWLPLWHQCREILEKAGYYFLLLVKGDNIQLDLWRRDPGKYIDVFRGSTVLEVMYKALLYVKKI